MAIKDNIMTDIDLLLKKSNPEFLARKVSANFKKNRIIQNYTQLELSERSGVALSNLKRFEQKAEISLINLLKLAITLDSTENFENLFTESQHNSLDEFLKEKQIKNRKRVRKK